MPPFAMGPSASGFVLALDVVPFDARWVLLPGLGFLAAGFGLLLLLRGMPHVHPQQRRLLAASAGLLFLLAVWWTLGGVGAWRAGVARLGNGTADFVEGTLAVTARSRSGDVVGFRVASVPFRRPLDAACPSLHATRWPAGLLGEGQRVRLWYFGDDVLRLEAGPPP
jgi:hypothetical protein